MKKKVSIVGILAVVIMVVFLTGCFDKTNVITGTASTEENEINKLEFEEKGTYVKSAFGEEYNIYRFDEPNSTIVVYETIDGIFLVGKDAKEKGISYGNVFMPERKFIALSDKYILFETEDGIQIAVEIEKKKYVKNGEGFYNEVLYEELPDNEKNAFIYPIECEKVKD